MSEAPPQPDASLRRGHLYLQQGRYAEAEACFLEALSADPDRSEALHAVAVCRLGQDGREREALEAAQHALASDPANPWYHATRARALLGCERSDEALRAAEEAVALDPSCGYALSARTAALLTMSRWAAAEASAREALALDPEDSVAANHLALTLRRQGRLEENAEQLQGMLARDPEDAFTHASAGWHALQTGNRAKAETHFLEALRLDPGFEYAREGLLESFRARSPVYRVYLAYCHRMAAFSSASRWALVIGAYVLFRFASKMAQATGSLVLALVVMVYAAFALWTHFAVPVGNLIVLRDRRARHALRFYERLDALVCGGAVLLAVALVPVNLVTGLAAAAIVAMVLIGAALPLHYAISTRRAAGRWVFGAITAVILATGALVFAAPWLSLAARAWISPLAGLSLLLFLASQFLAGVPALNARR